MRLESIVAVLAACGGASAPAPEPTAAPAPVVATPSCADVIAAIRPLAFEVAGATTDDEREAVASSIEPMLEKTRVECESSWSPAYRSCAHAARTEEAMFACDREAAIERGEDLGGPSCEQVADHLTKVTIDPIGPKADHRAELHARFVIYCQPWPRARKQCVLAASTTEAIAACGET